MRSCIATLGFSLLAAAAPQTPDKPISFYAQLYKESDNCSGGGKTAAYLGSRGNCVNIPISGNGSAIIKVGEAAKYYLAGWTEPDCKGTVVLVESSPGVCTSLGGTDVASWSDDTSPFGE